jgi:hypothetical protein
MSCAHLGRPGRGRDLLLVQWRHRQGHKGGATGSTVVRRCSKQDILQWTHQLLLRRTYPWPHRDGADPGIVEGGPRWGAPAVVAGAARAVVLAFPFPLVLTLAFTTIVGVGGRRERGRLRTW